jgi:hypothetical protein
MPWQSGFSSSGKPVSVHRTNERAGNVERERRNGERGGGGGEGREGGVEEVKWREGEGRGRRGGGKKEEAEGRDERGS